MATILVVDDEAPIRNAIQRFLKIKGHDVVLAEDGVQALDFLNVHEVKLAIVDLMMPRMNGVELINCMETDYPDTRVVVISAFSDIGAVTTSQSNVSTILTKPFELRNLAEAVEHALDDQQGAPTG